MQLEPGKMYETVSGLPVECLTKIGLQYLCVIRDPKRPAWYYTGKWTATGMLVGKGDPHGRWQLRPPQLRVDKVVVLCRRATEHGWEYRVVDVDDEEAYATAQNDDFHCLGEHTITFTIPKEAP